MTVILRLLLALLAVLLPAATPVTEPPLSEYGPAQPVQSMPAPTAEIGTALVGGVATWFDAPGLQAAVPWWDGHRILVRVCASRCVIVTATGFCACGDRDGSPTVADLSREAFARLAPLSAGVVQVTLEWPLEPLPPTDQ